MSNFLKFNSGKPTGTAIAAADLPTITLTGDISGSAAGGTIATTLASSISGAKTFSTSLSTPSFMITSGGSIFEPDDVAADGVKAASIPIHASNKTNGASTGDGGDLNLTGGTSVGGAGGSIAISGGSGVTQGTVSFSSRNLNFGATGSLTVNGTATAAQFRRYASDTNATSLTLSKARGTQTTPTIIVAGDIIAALTPKGYDGATFQSAANILFVSDATGSVGAGSMPGKIVVLTTPTGSATPVAALTIGQDQKSTFSGGVNLSTLTASQALVLDGSQNVTTLAYSTTPTASTLAEFDANKNLSANNSLLGYTSTATAATTTTLVVGSTFQQYFTGSTTQIVQLPATSTLVLGQQYNIINLSTGVVTVQSSGSNTLQAMASNTQLTATVISTAGSGTASWNWNYSQVQAPLSLNGRAGSQSISSAATSQAITFSSTLGTTGYAISACFVNTTDTNPQFQPITITAQSATGFTAKWSDPTATANYSIQYIATVNS